MKKSITLFVLTLLSVFVLSLTACRETKSTEEKVEDGIEEVGEGLEEGAEEVGETVEEGVEETEDAVEDATDDN